MNPEKVTSPQPRFDFMSYFEGHTRVSGWFMDRFGNVKRHFCGDFHGDPVNGILELDEKLYYSDGIEEQRVWTVDIADDGAFSATSESLIGPATGQQAGNALKMQYTMNVLVAKDRTWALDMDDAMVLQPDGSLHNITTVKRWGIRIGSVSAQYERHDGSRRCQDLIEKTADGSGVAVRSRPKLRVYSRG